MTSRLLTVEETAERLAVSPRSVRRYVAAGQLRCRRPGGKLLRIHEDDLEQYLCELANPISGDTEGGTQSSIGTEDIAAASRSAKLAIWKPRSR